LGFFGQRKALFPGYNSDLLSVCADNPDFSCLDFVVYAVFLLDYAELFI